MTRLWPRPVVLVEADLAGSDLVFRVRTSDGELLDESRGIVPLAVASRQEAPSAASLTSFAQALSATSWVVKGVTGPAQARSLAALWAHIAAVCEASDQDVIIDFGRLNRDSDTIALAARCDVMLLVLAATLEGVHHVAAQMAELSTALAGVNPTVIRPLVIGPDTHAANDRRDIAAFLADRGVLVDPTLSLPYDPRGLGFIESGEVSSNRANRSLLVRAGGVVVKTVASTATDMAGAR
ncbi:MAG: hypothetical protein GX678_05590 [Actinomycetales bacterium]|nr:hypothetical protein [Actinomycetales bacterium]